MHCWAGYSISCNPAKNGLNFRYERLHYAIITEYVSGGERLYHCGGQNWASIGGKEKRKYLGLFSVTVCLATRKVDESWPPEWSNFCPPPMLRATIFGQRFHHYSAENPSKRLALFGQAVSWLSRGGVRFGGRGRGTGRDSRAAKRTVKVIFPRPDTARSPPQNRPN